MNKLYDIAKGHIGQHLSLNENVPHALGCAQAVSFILKELGQAIPKGGISGTASLYIWLQTRCDKIPDYEVGAIIISVTGTGLPGTHGHVGVCGYNAIMSNDSETGLWQPYWNISGWKGYYQDKLGMKVQFFRLRE